MSDPSEISGRPLASIIQQPEQVNQQPSLRRKRTTPQSSDERIDGTKSALSRRRPATRKDASSSRGASSTMQRSASPTQMSPEMSSVNYTRTGRVSKAKKGLKVHNCECGRSYTRAEHLRRHQKNHIQNPLVCDFPDCGKSFYRPDLLHRHQERHNEIDNKDSRRTSFISQSSAADEKPSVSASVALPTPIVTTLSQQSSSFYPITVSPLPEATPPPRYTSNQFRTPQLPSSVFGPNLRSSPTSNFISNHIKPRTHAARQATSVTIPVQVDGQHPITWNDPFAHSHSPNYSSSSGYASPMPGTNDYTNNMFANPPYGSASIRTRESSNASYIGDWNYPSRSPTSATSTMAYAWTSNEKAPPASLAYMNANSYPLSDMSMSAGVDQMSGYGHGPFAPKSMAQRDEEEQAYLFPEQSFGMGQIANPFPYEQYLDNYWRLFHPSFPVVHRATFQLVNGSPMLRAAMFAIGAQYSNDPIAKRKSRFLHDRCMKLLDKRVRDAMTDPDQLCDYQALFLIEVLSQYCARRVANSLSDRFGTVYQWLSQNFQTVNSRTNDIISSVVQTGNATHNLWSEWIDLAGQKRLLLCCYILEYQQAVFLARSPQQSMIQDYGIDLPFPEHFSLWEADNHMDWGMHAHQNLYLPIYVYEIAPDVSTGPFDHFQSLLLIAAHYNHFNNHTPYLSPPVLPAIEHLIDDSPTTKHALLTAKLLQVTPIRALLAVSGESWILSEKVSSPADFQGFKSTLKVWVNSLWASTSVQQFQIVKEALQLSIQILQQAMSVPAQNLSFGLGADMGLYYAVLVIWAVTVGSNSRINAAQATLQPGPYQSHTPLSSNNTSGHLPTTLTHLTATTPLSYSPNPIHPSTMGLIPTPATSSAPPHTTPDFLHPEFTMPSANFLDDALVELEFLGISSQWPRDVLKWQQDCGTLLRWLKTRHRSGLMEGRDSVISPGITSAGRGGDGLGELVDGVVAVLEKILWRLWRGWEEWGI